MNVLKRIILSVIVVMGLVVAPIAVSSTAIAATPKEELCKGSGGVWRGNACTNTNAGGSIETYFKSVVNILLFVIGAVAVVMIVIGGIRYVVSGGDQSSVTGAKNTILYAVVGLAVAILAYSIVNFVVTNL